MRRLKPIILTIDDDIEFRKSIEIVLGRMGFQVIGVSETEEFLVNVEKFKPDLYLIDLQLGARSGFELIEALRKGDQKREPIIVVSGDKRPETISHALELGADDYILKPLDRSFLASKLAIYLPSDALAEEAPAYAEVPRDRKGARIEFAASVAEVDELGVRLHSPHLVPKGTVLKLRCDPLLQAGVAEGEALVMVTSTELLPDESGYSIYVEFDGVDVDFMQRVRRWLTH